MIPIGITASSYNQSQGFPNPRITQNYTATRSDTNGETSVTWSNVDFGTAETGRIVCVFLTGGMQQSSTTTVTSDMSVTIGGQSATLLVGSNTTIARSIWAVQLDSGTSGTVVASLSNSKTFGGKQQIACFSVYDADINAVSSVKDVGRIGSFNTNANFTLNVPINTGGAIVYGVNATAVASPGETFSYTNASEIVATYQDPHDVGLAKLQDATPSATTSQETISNTSTDTVVNYTGAVAVGFMKENTYNTLTLDTIDVRDPAKYEITSTSNTTAAYGVHRVKFTADSTSHTLYIGFTLRGSGISAFYKDYTVGGVRLRYGSTTSEFRHTTWTGWQTTTAGVPSSTSPTGLNYTNVISGTTAERFNIDSAGTASSSTGMANGISLTPDWDGDVIPQLGGNSYVYVETSSPMVNGDTIWLKYAFSPAIGDEVKIDIADYLNTVNTATYSTVVQDSVRILVT